MPECSNAYVRIAAPLGGEPAKKEFTNEGRIPIMTLFREETPMKLPNWMTWLTAAAVVVLGVAAGCDKNKDMREKAENEFFKGDGVERVTPALNAQATNGARHDAMLYPHHF